MTSIVLLHCFAVVIISSAQFCQALEQCRPSTYSVYGHHLSGHVMSTAMSSSLSECVMMCFNEFRCRSLNFLLKDKSCDLNDADKHTHPEHYGPEEGSVYMDTSERHKHENGLKSCAEIHREWPQAESGYYWVKIGSRDAQVYCDMKNHGGGWTLVASISSKNNDHLQRASNNCLNSVLCVPFSNKNITSRKLSDEDIHQLARTQGTFRVDILRNDNTVTIYYQIPSGPEKFNSTCAWGHCPRIIISHSYPYQWETNNYTSIHVGYRIYKGYHRVFDGHDDGECGQSSYWISSKYGIGIRGLYGYPVPEEPQYYSHGLYKNQEGMLYVK